MELIERSRSRRQHGQEEWLKHLVIPEGCSKTQERLLKEVLGYMLGEQVLFDDDYVIRKLEVTKYSSSISIWCETGLEGSWFCDLWSMNIGVKGGQFGFTKSCNRKYFRGISWWNARVK